MAPKAAPKKSAASATASHASYQDMIKLAIINLKDRKGSSRQAIKKYIQSNNNLGGTTDAAFNSHVNRALAAGESQNVFERPKGPSGPVKLKKPAAKVATDAPKAAAPKKASAEKKTPAASKPKKTTTTATKKAPAAKKAAPAKPKANTKKTAVAKPAVDDKPAVVSGKTKSGRVTKTKAPAAVKKSAPKKAAPKKAVAKKAAPKKASTPKKDATAA